MHLLSLRYKTEFLNRIDDIILFNSLQKNDLHKIIDIELKSLYHRIEDMGFKITIDSEAKDYISDKGYDSQFGARPLKRAIQKYLEDVLAEEIINAHIQEGDTIKVIKDKNKDELKIKILKPKKSKSKNKK